MLDKFSPQGYTLKMNPFYRNKSTLSRAGDRLPVVQHQRQPGAADPERLRSTGQATTSLTSRATTCPRARRTTPGCPARPTSTPTTWCRCSSTPQKAPLNDPAVRQAISSASTGSSSPPQAETGYELPTSSTSGLMLPVETPTRPRRWPTTSRRPVTRPRWRRSSRPTATPRSTASGARTARRSRSRSPTRFPTATTTPTTSLVAHQLNALGFNVTVDGIGNPTVWAGDVANGTFDTTIRWSNQGPTPYRLLQRLAGQHAERPHRQAGHGRLRPVLQRRPPRRR